MPSSQQECGKRGVSLGEGYDRPTLAAFVTPHHRERTIMVPVMCCLTISAANTPMFRLAVSVRRSCDWTRSRGPSFWTLRGQSADWARPKFLPGTGAAQPGRPCGETISHDADVAGRGARRGWPTTDVELCISMSWAIPRRPGPSSNCGKPFRGTRDRAICCAIGIPFSAATSIPTPSSLKKPRSPLRGWRAALLSPLFAATDRARLLGLRDRSNNASKNGRSCDVRHRVHTSPNARLSSPLTGIGLLGARHEPPD